MASVSLAMTQKADALRDVQNQNFPPLGAEPGFAPPAADINAASTGASLTSYPDASRAIGNYINSIWARLIATVLLVIAAISMGLSLNIEGLKTIGIIEGVVMVVLTGWQVWALFSYASHSPPQTDTRGTATTAAILTAIGGLIAVISAFTTEPTLRRSPATSGLTLLAGLMSLIAMLLVVSFCRRLATSFGDGRLEARGRSVNTMIGLTVGGFLLAFLMAFIGGGFLAVLLMLAGLGTAITAAVFYLMMLYGAKRTLAHGPAVLGQGPQMY